MDDEMTVTIPAEYVERFRTEALFALGSAAGTIQETAEWSRKPNKRDGRPKREVSPEDLQQFHDTEAMYVAAHAESDGDLTIEAKVKRLHSATIGVLLDVTEKLHGEAQDLTPDFGPILAEFEFWRELRERLARELEGGS